MCKTRVTGNIPAEELRLLFEYDAEKGLFRRITKNGYSVKGWVTGSVTRHGYFRFAIQGKYYFSHRLAFAIFYGRHPRGVIDHVNGNPQDNRIANLRDATQGQNLINQRVSKKSKSGYKGVYFNKHHGKWHAYARLNNQKIHLGYFIDPHDAYLAYTEFATKNHGEFYSGEARSTLQPTEQRGQNL